MRFREKFLIIESPGHYLSLAHGTISIALKGHKKYHLPLDDIQGIMIFGASSLSTPLLIELASQRTPVVITGRGGDSPIILNSNSKNTLLRRSQALASADNVRSLKLAHVIVDWKIRAMAGFSGSHDVGQFLVRLTEVRSYEELLGIEGIATREYYTWLREQWRSLGWSFTKRSYYPPQDASNALMSLAYSVLSTEVASWTQMFGLDPDFGFLHRLTYGRHSLVCDLMEPFRSEQADRFLLEFVSKNSLSPNIIQDQEGRLRLADRDLRKVFFSQLLGFLRSDQHEIARVDAVRAFYHFLLDNEDPQSLEAA